MFRNTFDKIFGPNTKASLQELEDLWFLMNLKHGMQIFHLLIRYMQDRIDNEERWLKALQETKTPLRLINGAYDPISGKHMAAHYHKVIPNPDVVLLENIGHYPQLEAPGEVLKHFLNFSTKPK
jgi:pimeloyl-ACP methyl ester carboxylesterase